MRSPGRDTPVPRDPSVVRVRTTVEAAAAPAAAPATTATNAGLRSDTGVEPVETGSTGDVAVAAGVRMLLLAGAGGVAVARNRRRTATGTEMVSTGS